MIVRHPLLLRSVRLVCGHPRRFALTVVVALAVLVALPIAALAAQATPVP